MAGPGAKQAPSSTFRGAGEVFSPADTQANNELKFGKSNGYSYAYTYVEFIHMIYGWEPVLALVVGESYEEALSLREEEAYAHWQDYLDLYYPTMTLA